MISKFLRPMGGHLIRLFLILQQCTKQSLELYLFYEIRD